LQGSAAAACTKDITLSCTCEAKRISAYGEKTKATAKEKACALRFDLEQYAGIS